MCRLSVSTFVLIRIHPGVILVDPGEAALRRRHRPLLLPTFSPTASADAAAVGCYRCRLRPLLSSVTAAAVNRRHCRPLLPSPLATSAAATRHCCRRPPFFPTAAAAAAAAAVGRYR